MPAPSNFRSRYIGRLAGARGWVVSRPPPHQTVSIFDWDDTLLCTTWLAACGASANRAAVSHVGAVAALACGVLAQALRAGPTFIVTNAATAWVKHSAAKWAPQLLPWLQKVRVISARDRYERAYPDEVQRWKTEAFLDLQRELPETTVTNLIALGDSDFEMIAANNLRENFEHAILKTVKFLPSPSPMVLRRELELVSQNFGKIATRPRSTKIDLNRKA